MRYIWLTLALLGVTAAAALQIDIAVRHHPSVVEWGEASYAIVRVDSSGVKGFRFVDRRSGRVALSVAGRTLPWDPPSIMRLDADGDGLDELIIRSPSQSGAVHFDPARHAPVFRPSSAEAQQPSRQRTFWVRELGEGATHLTAAAVVLALLAGTLATLSAHRAGADGASQQREPGTIGPR